MEGENDYIIVKVKHKIKSSLLEVRKRELINDQIYYRLQTTGAQPAGLFGLAKIHKIDTPLTPVLAVPGSTYNLQKYRTLLFENLPVAIIQASSLDARKELELSVLDDIKPIVF